MFVVQPILRRVLTRALGLVPSMAVAIAAGRGGVDALLVASQVALSIVLPFIVFPLLYLTNSKEIMAVKQSRSPSHDDTTHHDSEIVVDLKPGSDSRIEEKEVRAVFPTVVDLEGTTETVDFANHKVAVVVGWVLWFIIVAANIYAIVTLAMGDE